MKSHATKNADWQTKWRNAIEAYAREVNEYVSRGCAEGWDALVEPEFPALPEGAAQRVLAELRSCNADSPVLPLSDRLPPSHLGLIALVEERGKALCGALLLHDGRILLRAGTAWQDGYVWELNGGESTPYPDLLFVGRSPDRRYFVEARATELTITDGWRGAQIGVLPWPTGREGLPVSPLVEYQLDPPPFPITELIVFPDGQRVLLVSERGIFVIGTTCITRLFPTQLSVEVMLDDCGDQGDGPVEYSPWCAMPYGAISADGRFLSAGHQCSDEGIFDANTLRLVGTVGSSSSYPHHAGFTPDGEYVFSNSCHFYNGHSVCVPTHLLTLEAKIEATENQNPNGRGVSQFTEGARIYASAAHGHVFYYGDAAGYVHARRVDGALLWRHHIGSSVSSLDISADGQTLIAATCAGFLVELKLDGAERRPFEIGLKGAREVRRWIVWKHETKPLLWA